MTLRVDPSGWAVSVARLTKSAANKGRQQRSATGTLITQVVQQGKGRLQSSLLSAA